MSNSLKWATAYHCPLSSAVFQSLLKLMSFESVMLSNHLILCLQLLLLASIFTSIRVLSSELAFHIRQPKHWNFSFSISVSNEYSVLISLGLTDLIFLQSTGLLRVFSSTTSQKHQLLSLLYGPALTCACDSWKNHSFM